MIDRENDLNAASGFILALYKLGFSYEVCVVLQGNSSVWIRRFA